MEEERPRYSRRRYQKTLKRRRRRRQSRVRRLKALRALIGLRFWTRATTFLFIALCVAFWAKFAVVYDIPRNIGYPSLVSVSAYVTAKPWWFGPPAFDLESTAESNAAPYLSTTDAINEGLGRYVEVVSQPVFIWVMKR